MKFYILSLLFAAPVPVAYAQTCLQNSPTPPPNDPPYTYTAGSGNGLDKYLCSDAHLATFRVQPVYGKVVKSAMLSISAYDVDPTEINHITVEGAQVGDLKTGGNNCWSLTELDVTASIQVKQEHEIHTDIENSGMWCSTIDWVSLQITFMKDPNKKKNNDSKKKSSSKTVAVFGDPHFNTWSGERYDFHGVCDLLLLSNPEFGNHLGLDIHVRTKITRAWSYVYAAAVRIGDETLEIVGGKLENNFWFNGSQESELPKSISGYDVTLFEYGAASRKLVIDLFDGALIELKSWNTYVSVSVGSGNSKQFDSSVGLMGTFPDGVRIGRDNHTEYEDSNAFGQEWQVLPTEPKIFHNLEGPQSPSKCEIPSKSQMRRRLGESLISKGEAEAACSRVSAEDFDLCVFDVMATNDKNLAGAY